MSKIYAKIQAKRKKALAISYNLKVDQEFFILEQKKKKAERT